MTKELKAELEELEKLMHSTECKLREIIFRLEVLCSPSSIDDPKPACPYCDDTHIILDGDEERPCWHCYDFEGG